MDNQLDEHGFGCIKQIGKGAYGKVVKAKRRKDGKMYAIKIMPLEKNKTRLKYQRRELELLATLNHTKLSRNVIKYFGSWILRDGDEQLLCIRMELCSTNLEAFVYKNNMGGPEIIKAQEQGQPRFYQHVFRQILDGISAIHAMCWVHRDIHPGNILIANPCPLRISDIVIKIADFGLARHVGVQLKRTIGLTIVPRLERVSYFSQNGYFRAAELSTDSYDFKVDVYSAGMVLYFISCYLEDSSNWEQEIQDLKQGQLEINERVYHKDDEKLCALIQNLLEEDPKTRLTAFDAKEYMFPTEAKDSTDASGALNVQFYARKDDEDDFSLCFLNEFTLSAITEEVRSRIGVSEITSEDLRQECELSGKRRRVKIDCDEVVEAMFRKAAKDGSHVDVIVRAKRNEDSSMQMEQPEPGQIKENTSSEFP